MTELDEQRRKVEALKKKILEQKKKPEDLSNSESSLEGSVQEDSIFLDEESLLRENTAKERDESEGKKIKDVSIQKEERERLQALADAKRQVEEAAKKRHVDRKKETPSTSREAQDVEQVEESPISSVMHAYKQALKQAWSDGLISSDEDQILGSLRSSLSISPEDRETMEGEVRLEIYLDAIVEGWRDGAISHDDSEKLEKMREMFKISAEEHFRLEKRVRQEMLRK